jgi:hypothetical protein
MMKPTAQEMSRAAHAEVLVDDVGHDEHDRPEHHARGE